MTQELRSSAAPSVGREAGRKHPQARGKSPEIEMVPKTFYLIISQTVIDKYDDQPFEIHADFYEGSKKHSFATAYVQQFDDCPRICHPFQVNFPSGRIANIRYTYSLHVPAKKGNKKVIKEYPQKFHSDENVHVDILERANDVETQIFRRGFFDYVLYWALLVTAENLVTVLHEHKAVHENLPLEVKKETLGTYISEINRMYREVLASSSNRTTGTFLFCILPFVEKHDSLESLTPDAANYILECLNYEDVRHIMNTRKKCSLLKHLVVCVEGVTVSWEESLPYVFPFLVVIECEEFKNDFSGGKVSLEVLKKVVLKLLSVPAHDHAEGLLMLVCNKQSLEILREIEKLVPPQLEGLKDVIHNRYVNLLSQMHDEVSDDTKSVWKHVVSEITFINEKLLNSISQIRPIQFMLDLRDILYKKDCWREKADGKMKRDFEDKLLTVLETEVSRVTTISDIVNFWMGFKGWLWNMEHLAKITRSKTSELCKTSFKIKDLEALENLLSEKTLFSDSSDYSEVAVSIIKHCGANSRRLIVFLLHQVEVVSKDIQEELRSWFTLKLKQLAEDQCPKKIKPMYSMLLEFLGAPCVQKDGTLCRHLEQTVQDTLQTLGFQTLLNQVSEIQEMPENRRQKLEEHLKSIISSNPDFASASHFNKETVEVKTSLQALICTAMLNCKKVPSRETVAETDIPLEIEKLFTESRFWRCIFTTKGRFSNEVKDHPNAKNCKKMLDSMSSMVTEGTALVRIALCIIEIINQNGKGDFLRLIKAVSRKSKLSSCLDQLEEYLSTCTSAIKQVKAFEGLYLELVPNRKSISTKLDIIMGKLSGDDCCTVADIFDKTLDLGQLNDVTKRLELLQTLKGSKVFIKLCRQSLSSTGVVECQSALEDKLECRVKDDNFSTNLQDLFHGQSMPQTETLQPTSCKSFHDLIHYLSSDVYSLFENYARLFQGEANVTISHVREVFDGCSPISEEVEFMQQRFEIDITQDTIVALLSFEEYNKYKRLAEYIQELIQCVGVLVLEDDDVLLNINAVIHCQDESTKLKELARNVQFISSLEIDDKTDEILSELRVSKEMLKFLKSVDGDFTEMIDFVDQSDAITDTEVRGLIEVSRFLRPLLLFSKHAHNAHEILQKLTELCFNASHDICLKIKNCNDNLHALKNLHVRVETGEESPKANVTNVMQSGKFDFSIQSGQCCVTVSGCEKQDFAYLQDLNNKTLLTINKDTKSCESGMAVDDKNDKSTLTEFANIYKIICDIKETSIQLHESGHFKYSTFSKKSQTKDDLKVLAGKLEDDLQHWHGTLKEARRDSYFLNYVFSDQLWTLLRFFETGEHQNAALPLLRYVNSNLSPETEFHRCDNLTLPSEEETLSFLGKHMQEVLEGVPPVDRPLGYTDDSIDWAYFMENSIPLIVHQREERMSVIPTVMKLYGTSTGMFPQAHQILFCTPSSHWEDINLLLTRCCLSKSVKNLFCLVNVEQLPNELQFKLVDELYNFKENASKTSRLSIICTGSTSNPVLDRYSKTIQTIPPMAEKEVKSYLRSQCADVLTITSAIPGLGKSERVVEEAHKLKKKRVHFTINGPFDKAEIVKRLQNSGVNQNSLLHFDLHDVDDPRQLDIFIFELLVLGVVSGGTKRFALPTKHVCIEIGNTIDQRLENALHMCTSFKKDELRWNNYKHYSLSLNERESPIQIVCSYLNQLDSGTLDSFDIQLSEATHALEAERCQQLLRKYIKVDDMSYSIADSIMNVLADQLKKLSCSEYFQTTNLNLMKGPTSTVKSIFVTEMIRAYTDFANRSVGAYRKLQKENVQFIEETSKLPSHRMVERVQGLLRWEDSNHLLPVFQSRDFCTVTLLYRELAKVPEQISELFERQIGQPLPNFCDVDQNFLLRELLKVVRKGDAAPANETSCYALTPDNLLKMVLIYLRSKARVPVLIMGETGCGKTYLVTYLANIADCNLETFHIHAGISARDVIQKVKDVSDKAEKNLAHQHWLFLDEINTCQHLGLINELLCHRTCRGVPLAPNLVFIAACNPYRAREQILTAGIKDNVSTDDRSPLVYRVHPLPEGMIDYVWDFGSIDPASERAYIQRMVGMSLKSRSEMFVELLASSQEFIREYENTSCCVSLRDVLRCIELYRWFRSDYLMKKSKANRVQYTDDELELRSVVLSLAHCYNSRLRTTDDRNGYCELIADILRQHGQSITENSFEAILREEHLYLLDKMNIPDNIAKNTALCENVFVILVCLLNKIPVFVVGKPGSSKSLSMQLIRKNLRGQDSTSDFFALLPHIIVVSHQGSESSTSEGVTKVFDKAKQYKDLKGNYLPVVLLDEVGLAEQSPFNPLKVLHSLLERDGGKRPEVAVVGISNWALDEAKMNRAIHLVRSEPDVRELIGTALAIDTQHRLSQNELRAVSELYFKHQDTQKHESFHGLRDFYSFVKYLCKKTRLEFDVNVWRKGLLRNFGGLINSHDIVKNFFDLIHREEGSVTPVPVNDLVQDNLSDTDARHLMLITHGGSGLGIFENFVNKQRRQYEVMLGSQFEEDLSENYNYRVLNKIISSMKLGRILVLKDLDNVYGSLYDMLNQNYIITGSSKRKNCRIALGPNSNSMCYVHDEFRCVVLVDINKVQYSDPPFLNRFEKQRLTFRDVLSDEQESAIKHLEIWVKALTTISGFTHAFTISSAIPAYSDDLLASLVLHIWPGVKSLTLDDKIDQCKKLLLWIFSPLGMLRASKSQFAEVATNVKSLRKWQDCYFNLPIHQGLSKFTKVLLNGKLQEQLEWYPDEHGFKVIIQTGSSLAFDVAGALKDTVSCQVERLSVFKSEEQLSSNIHQFWFESTKELLVLQCKPTLDGQHMLLAKTMIDRCRADYKQRQTGIAKHAIIIVHLDQEKCREEDWQFSFLCGWSLVNIDSLEMSTVSAPSLLGKQIVDVLRDSSMIDLKQIILENMCWAFSRIMYSGTPRSTASTLDIVRSMKHNQPNSEMTGYFAERIISWIADHYSNTLLEDNFSNDCWQVDLACNSLHTHSTSVATFSSYLQEKVREPLSLIVFQLESLGSWKGFKKHRDIWKEMFFDRSIFCIDDLPLHHEVEVYRVDGVRLDFSFPFSTVFADKTNESKSTFIQGYQSLSSVEDFEDQFADYQTNFADFMFATVPLLKSHIETCGCEDFIADLCNIVTANLFKFSSHADRIIVARCAINLGLESSEKSPLAQTVQFVTNYWVRENRVHSTLQLLSICSDSLTDGNVAGLVQEVISKMNIQTSSGGNFKGFFERSRHFESLLVDEACEALYPTEAIVKCYDGIRSWQSKVNMVLLNASQIGHESTTLNFLRFCNDFVMNLQIPYKLDDHAVSRLACAALEDDIPLYSKKIFQHLVHLSEELDPPRAVQQFICTYLMRCYTTNQYCSPLTEFFARIPSVCPEYLGIVIDDIWSEENDNYEDAESGNGNHEFNTVTCLLKDEHFLKKRTNLLNLDTAIRNCFDRGNSHLAILTCDVIETYVLKFIPDLQGNIGDDQTMQLLKTAVTCHSIVQTESLPSLKVVTAIGFIKAFVRAIASCLEKKPKFSHKANSFLQEVSTIIRATEGAEHCRGKSVQQFFFKCLHAGGMGFRELQRTCEKYGNKIPALKTIMWTNQENVNPIGFKVMPTDEKYQEVLKVLSSVGSDKSILTAFVKEARKSPEKVFALLSDIVDNYYLISGSRPLKKVEKEAVRIFVTSMNDYPQDAVRVLECLCSDDQFQLEFLNIHPGTTFPDIQLASVMVHAICVMLAYRESIKDTVLGRAFYHPSHEFCIPLKQGKRTENSSVHSISVFKCSCMNMIGMIASSSTARCPVCKKELGNELVSDPTCDNIERSSQPRVQATVNWSNLTPASFTILRFLFHTCLLTGEAIRGKTDSRLPATELESSQSEATKDTNVLKKVKDAWESLTELLALPSHQVCCFMHVVLERLQPGLVPVSDSEWEKSFIADIEELIKQRHGIILEKMQKGRVTNNSFESEIEETDVRNSRQGLSQLFRYVPDKFAPFKSTSLLHSSYKLSADRQKHPFLGLFFEVGDCLGVLKSLSAILKWQSTAISHKSHRISRNDENLPVQQALASDHIHEKDRGKLRDILMEFIDQWNTVRIFSGVLAEYDDSLGELPRLNIQSQFKDCIASSRDSVLFKVVKCLTSVQNAFLDKVLRMAASGECIALSFLLQNKDTAVIPITPIRDIPVIPVSQATPSEIIHCSWKEWKKDLLRLSQCNTSYGMGNDVQFDFAAIEMDLCNYLVLGKAFLLLDDSFPLFTYAHELSPNSNLLSKLKKVIKQEDLPEAAAEKLEEMYDQSSSSVIDLKHQLDFIMHSLSKSSSPNQATIAIKDYAEPMVYKPIANSFPDKLFPDPLEKLPLCHIVGLYEAIEDLLCRNVEDTLQDDFTSKLAEEDDKKLVSKIKTTDIDLSRLLKFLRQTIFRYFYAVVAKDPSMMLIKLLEGQVPSSDTPEGQAYVQHLRDLFPEYIQLAHLFVVAKHIDKVVKERMDKPKFAAANPFSRPRRTGIRKT